MHFDIFQEKKEREERERAIRIAEAAKESLSGARHTEQKLINAKLCQRHLLLYDVSVYHSLFTDLTIFLYAMFPVPSIDVKSCLYIKAWPHGREKPTSSMSRCRGMRIPAAKHGEVHVAIVVHGKHVLFSRQRQVLTCTTCTLLLDEYVPCCHCIHLFHFVTFFI